MLWRSGGRRVVAGLLPGRSASLRAARCPPHSRRGFSSSVSEEATPPVKRWSLSVSPFTTVRAQVGCSISVRPLDLHAFPEADRAFVSVHGTSTPDGLDRLQVRYDKESSELLISAEGLSSQVSIDMAAPIKSNLFITTQGNGNVQVKKMECDLCRVQTEKGDCLLHSVKGHQIEVQSSGGHVSGVGTIHGNVDIRTQGDGAVDVKKLQGTRMNMSTERGSMKVKAIYAESSTLSTSSGKVEVGNVHGNTTVRNVSGDTVIDGSNSFLNVFSHSGAIDVYVGDGGSAELHSQEGAVHVRVPPSLKAGYELSGAVVDISPELTLHALQNSSSEGRTTVSGYMNGELPLDQWIKARAERGSVTVRTQSWFESLRLGQ